MDTYNEIWNAVLSYCEQRVTETAFNLWIKKTEFVSFEAATITLRLPSAMYMDVVISQYGTMFSEAFAAVMGFEVKIKYVCAEDNDREEHKFYQDKQHLEDYKNEQYTFENFIVGSSNRFAYVAEQFVNEFMQALQYKTTDEFHDKFRNSIDLLLIDDIQFIAGKQQTIEEFFHTFDTLVFAGKQVVITSDRPPREIQSITDRLKSRFEDGLLADIQPPEYETRCEIIKRKAMMLNFEIPDPVIDYIADKVKSNIRQLEGVTKKLYAYCDINQNTPTIALAQNFVKVVMEDTQPLPVTIQKIVEEVSRTTGVSVEDIYGGQRKKTISDARKITFYVIRKVTNMSYEDIGAEFKKHHSTVMYNIDQIEKDIETDTKLARQINDIISNAKSIQ